MWPFWVLSLTFKSIPSQFHHGWPWTPTVFPAWSSWLLMCLLSSWPSCYCCLLVFEISMFAPFMVGKLLQGRLEFWGPLPCGCLLLDLCCPQILVVLISSDCSLCPLSPFGLVLTIPLCCELIHIIKRKSQSKCVQLVSFLFGILAASDSACIGCSPVPFNRCFVYCVLYWLWWETESDIQYSVMAGMKPMCMHLKKIRYFVYFYWGQIHIIKSTVSKYTT